MGDSMEQVTAKRPTFCGEFLLKLMEGCQLSHVALGDVIDGCRVLCSRTASEVNVVDSFLIIFIIITSRMDHMRSMLPLIKI